MCLSSIFLLSSFPMDERAGVRLVGHRAQTWLPTWGDKNGIKRERASSLLGSAVPAKALEMGQLRVGQDRRI